MYQSEAWQKTDGILEMSNGGEFNNEANYKGESGARKTIKSTAP